MATDPPISLVLGDLPLAGGLPVRDTYRITSEGDDASWGNPQPIETVVQTLVQQGSSVEIDRYDNREVFVRVEIAALDGLSLAEGEEALFAELGKRNRLTWTPPQTFAPPTVFWVVSSSMDFEFDDFGEVLGKRVYGIRLVCEPWARSVDEVVIEAEVLPTLDGDPVDPIDDLVDACTSTTGWGASGGVTTSGGAVIGGGALGPYHIARTGTIDLTDTPILVVDVYASKPLAQLAIQYDEIGPFDGPIAYGPSPSPDFTRYYFKPGHTSIDTFRIRGTFLMGDVGHLEVSEVRQRNSPPGSGTLRQKYMAADVPGSAPSGGTVEVYHPTDGLGVTLVHTSPARDGQQFRPPLQPYLDTSGTITPDDTLVSGGSSVISSTANVYLVPVTLVNPGTYEIGAWLKCNAAATKTVTCTLSARDADDAFIGGLVDLSTQVTFPAGDTWYYFPLGRVQLPTLRVPSTSSGKLAVVIEATSGTVELDEAYLFNVDRGELTRVDAGGNTRVWLKAATIEDPTPAIMVGTLEDETDSVSSEAVSAWGIHETTPPAVNVFVVTRDAVDPGVRVRLTPAHHTHAVL